MKVTEIDESELLKIDHSHVLRGPSFSDSNLPDFESGIPNNAKIESGYYKVNRNIYMSIWKYKKFYGGLNSNEENYNDAYDMIKNGFISEKIIVHTHSPYFPTVNGYLRGELNKFYN